MPLIPISLEPDLTRQRSAVRTGAGLALAFAALAFAGCASKAPESRQQVAASQSTVDRAASATGGDAASDVAAARDKLGQAQRALAEKNYERARQLAEQAEADAVLAEARAREKRSGVALDEVREGLRALRAELARAPS